MTKIPLNLTWIRLPLDSQAELGNHNKDALFFRQSSVPRGTGPLSPILTGRLHLSPIGETENRPVLQRRAALLESDSV